MLPVDPPARRPWRAVRWWLPPQPFDGVRLRLETVQTYAAYEVLASTGLLHGDPDLAEPEFTGAYAWLSAEMQRRLPSVGHSGMIWAWARIGRRELLKGLRRAPGDVLLTLEVPAERVLLHGFGDWHAVLNRCLLVPEQPGETIDEYWRRTESTLDDFDRRVSEAGVRHAWGADWPAELRRDVEASWGLIFDPDSWHPSIAVQATLREVRASDVVRAVRIADDRSFRVRHPL